MPLIDVSALLSPVYDAAPCGPDLARDEAFLALATAARGKPSQEFGSVVVAAVEPNWVEVHRLGTELLARSKDLRIAVELTRAWTVRHGLGGLAGALMLIHGLLERYWDTLHPQLDADDGNDPTRRVNTLAALAEPTAVPLLARGTTFDGQRVGLTGRDVELAANRAQPAKGEARPSGEGVLAALRDAEKREPGLLARLRDGHLALAATLALLEQRAPRRGPDLAPLARFTRLLHDCALAALDPAATSAFAPAVPGTPGAATSPSTDAATAPPAQPPAADGAIRSRDDAMRALDRVCDWIERNEPGHPAPMLIQRARRLMAKNFIEIIKDILPEQLGQVQKLAGVAADK